MAHIPFDLSKPTAPSQFTQNLHVVTILNQTAEKLEVNFFLLVHLEQYVNTLKKKLKNLCFAG